MKIDGNPIAPRYTTQQQELQVSERLESECAALEARVLALWKGDPQALHEAITASEDKLDAIYGALSLDQVVVLSAFHILTAARTLMRDYEADIGQPGLYSEGRLQDVREMLTEADLLRRVSERYPEALR